MVPEKTLSKKRGFTLIEVMISLVILGIVVLGIYNIYIYMHKTWITEELKTEMQQRARVALDTMVKDIMMAGYGTGSAGSLTADDKIVVANSDELKFRAYLQDAPIPKEYYINYKIHEGNLKKIVSAVDGTGTTQTIVLAEHPKTNGLIFKYYRDNGTEFSPSTTEEKREIRRITLSVTLQSAKKIPGTNVYKEMTLTADISPRNLREGEMALDEDEPSQPTGLRVIDTQNCQVCEACGKGMLKAKWNKSNDNVAVAGYLIKYGTTSGVYTIYQDVPVSSLADSNNPSYEFPVQFSPYTGGSVTSYYVTVQAYDRAYNYSDPALPVNAANPMTNITSLLQSGNASDTTCNIKKPGAPGSFTATSATDSVSLTWAAPSGMNVAGYRIYRSYSSFNPSTDFPLPDPVTGSRITQLTKEDSVGWAGAVTGAAAGSYTDSDDALIGCKPYYYAICAVTCDSSRIWGSGASDTGRYTSAQYALSSPAAPNDTIKPDKPEISAKSGWQRVFLSVNWPDNIDYHHTKIYFATGDTPPPPYDSNYPNALDQYLIADRQSGYDKGTFYNYGTSSEHTIIFNYAPTGTEDETDLADGDDPQLVNGQTYSFRAVAFDNCGIPSESITDVAVTATELCGDDPCGAPTWTAAQKYVWVDGAATTLNAASWDTTAETATQINIGLLWTDVDTDSWTTAKDFSGFYVYRNTTDSLTESAVNVDSSQWNNYTESAGLHEGTVYYYGIRAADCIYESINSTEVIDQCGNPPVAVTKTYTDIRNENISPPFWSGAIMPGKLAMYNRTDTQSANPEYNAVTTSGQYHNTVRFYIQNTSQAQLNLDWMKFRWGNTAAYLKSVTIGPGGTEGTVYTHTPPGLVSSSSDSQIIIDRRITKVASGSATSDAVPITLEFVDVNGNESDIVDMRREVIKMELSFTNTSMPNAEGSANGVSGFTTGQIYDTGGLAPITFPVSGGPGVNWIKQSRPVTQIGGPTDAFEVDTGSTWPSSGIPEVNGGSQVDVTANVTRPANETITSVRVYHAHTDLSWQDPGSATFDYGFDDTPSGSDYTVTIPGYISQGVWYYVVAQTSQGNFVRSPAENDSYYYYKQLTFDPCRETPEEPTGLGGYVSGSPSVVTLSWTAPGKYVSGDNINTPTYDSLTYNIYRRLGLTGSFPPTPLNFSATNGFIDGGYSATQIPTAQPVAYAVTAVNSCSSESGGNQSGKSEIFMVCPSGGLGCAIVGAPSEIYVGENIGVNVAVCPKANNGTSNETGVLRASTQSGRDTDDFNVTELNNTGTATLTIPTTKNESEGTPSILLVIGSGQVKDTVTISPASGTLFSGCSASATVDVYVNPDDNTPAKPTITGGSLSGSNLALSWSAVTTNTDGSTATYYPTTINGDSITGYEIWRSATDGNPNTDISTWSKVATAAATETSKSGISTPKGTYYYSVRAVDTKGNGEFSVDPQGTPQAYAVTRN